MRGTVRVRKYVVESSHLVLGELGAELIEDPRLVRIALRAAPQRTMKATC
jgi:hypothetical protein